MAKVKNCVLKAVKSITPREIIFGVLFVLCVISIVSPDLALAADDVSWSDTVGSTVGSTTTTGLPWEKPMATLQRSLTGPIAKAAAMIVVVCAGIFVALGEGGPAGRLVGRLVFGLGLLFGAVSIIGGFLQD